MLRIFSPPPLRFSEGTHPRFSLSVPFISPPVEPPSLRFPRYNSSPSLSAREPLASNPTFNRLLFFTPSTLSFLLL